MGFFVCRQTAPLVDRSGGAGTRRLKKEITAASLKLLQKSKGPSCLRMATEKVVHMVRDGFITSVLIDPVTTVATCPRAAHPSAATDGEAESAATITEAATGDGTTVKNSRGTGPVREDEIEYAIRKLAGHNYTKTGMQYCDGGYG